MIRRGQVVIMICFSTAVISILLTPKDSAEPRANRTLGLTDPAHHDLAMIPSLQHSGRRPG